MELGTGIRLNPPWPHWRMAEPKNTGATRDPVDKEIEERLRADLRNRGDFKAVHVLPASGQDVQDDHDARLVVLGPNYPHTREQEADSRASVGSESDLGISRLNSAIVQERAGVSWRRTRRGSRTWRTLCGTIWPGGQF